MNFWVSFGYRRPCHRQLHHPFAQKPEFAALICTTWLTCTPVCSASRSISGDWVTTLNPKYSFFFSLSFPFTLLGSCFSLIVDLRWCFHPESITGLRPKKELG